MWSWLPIWKSLKRKQTDSWRMRLCVVASYDRYPPRPVPEAVCRFLPVAMEYGWYDTVAIFLLVGFLKVIGWLLDEQNLDLMGLWSYSAGLSFLWVIDIKYYKECFLLCLIVYHMPGRSIHLSSRFAIQTCETNLVASFEKYLLEQLENLIHSLECEIQQWHVQCHASTDTLEKLTHRLTFQFAGKGKALFASFLCLRYFEITSWLSFLR